MWDLTCKNFIYLFVCCFFISWFVHFFSKIGAFFQKMHVDHKGEEVNVLVTQIFVVSTLFTWNYLEFRCFASLITMK